MSGGKRIAIGAAGGVVAVAYVVGLFAAGVYSPHWLGIVLPLLAIFAGGALFAIQIAGNR